MSDAKSYDDSDSKGIPKPSSDSIKVNSSCSTEDIKFERKTIRYVDWRMLPLLALIYSFALIDRINLGAAREAGMGEDLGLDIGARYSTATCLYFVPYILLQLPGVMVMRRLGARNWLSFIVFGWGLVQLGMGFVSTWGYLTLCRILLGALEASFFPCLIFIISTWYKRYEVQQRLAIFYMLSITISGFSPILAYAISLLSGHRGLSGWQWIFIIEGAVTICLGILAFVFIPDVPNKNEFLTPIQTELVLRRIEEDRGDSKPDPITPEKLKKHLCDWTLWAYGVMFACASLPAYAQAYFTPSILSGMGFSEAASLLLSAPPYGPSIFIVIFVSWLSDKYKHRSSFIFIQCIFCIAGLTLTAFAKANGIRYFGIFLTNAGNSGTIPGILAYGANNVVSHSKRTVQTSLTVSFAGIGGIVASTTYRQQDAPRYRPGLGVTIGSQVLIMTLLTLTTLHFTRLNRLMREGKRSKPLEGQPGFFYTL